MSKPVQLTSTVLVNDRRMFIRLYVDGEAVADLPMEQAKVWLRGLESLIPYRYGQVVGEARTVEALEPQAVDIFIGQEIGLQACNA